MAARHKVKEIVLKLRLVEELTASGKSISDCLQEIDLTEVTYYRWRNRYGGLESDQAERMTELEAEIAQLRRAVSDLTLDKLILMEATTGSLSPELRSSYVLHAKATMGIFGKARLSGPWAASIDATQGSSAPVAGGESGARSKVDDARRIAAEASGSLD